MKFVTSIIFIAFVSVVGYFIVIGIQSHVNNHPHPTLSSSGASVFPISTPDPEATYKNSFLQNCDKSSGGLADFCICNYEYLKARYTLSERHKMNAGYLQTKQLPQALTDAATACLREIPNADEIYRQSYIQGCMYGNSQLSEYCTCGYDHLLQQYTVSQIAEMTFEDKQHFQISQPKKDADSACKSYYPPSL
jgi:hypothetical protein